MVDNLIAPRTGCSQLRRPPATGDRICGSPLLYFASALPACFRGRVNARPRHSVTIVRPACVNRGETIEPFVSVSFHFGDKALTLIVRLQCRCVKRQKFISGGLSILLLRILRNASAFARARVTFASYFTSASVLITHISRRRLLRGRWSRVRRSRRPRIAKASGFGSSCGWRLNHCCLYPIFDWPRIILAKPMFFLFR